jgi:hypothetical protein
MYEVALLHTVARCIDTAHLSIDYLHVHIRYATGMHGIVLRFVLIGQAVLYCCSSL